MLVWDARVGKKLSTSARSMPWIHLGGPRWTVVAERADTSGDADDPAPGVVRVKTALVGVGFIWLTAVATVGAVLATAQGLTREAMYLPVATLAAAIAVSAGVAALRTFGYW
jgi:hypothetical protein